MGKNKYVESPEALQKLFTAYAKDVKENPRIKVDFVGKDAERVEIPLEAPLTMSGFECYVEDNGGPNGLEHYFANTGDAYALYRTVCSRIRKEIRNDQITGGMVGQYNASITQRLNNLKETTENTNLNHNIPLLNVDPLSDE